MDHIIQFIFLVAFRYDNCLDKENDALKKQELLIGKRVFDALHGGICINKKLVVIGVV